MMDEEALIPVLASDAGVLDFEFDGNVVTLAGTAVALLVDTAEGANWLRTHTAADMAALRMITLDSDANSETLALLEQLSVHNPALGLMSEDQNHLPRLLELFDPTRLILGDATIEEAHKVLLAGEDNLRTLMFSGEGQTNLDFLAEIPNLETIFLSDWDPGDAGPLPDGLRNLRSLFVLGGTLEELSVLGDQPRLEELRFLFCEEGPNSETLDLTALANHPLLKILSFHACPTVVDLSAVRALPKLRWLGLPASTTQDQLEEIVATHPNLTLLDLVWAEEITDLTPATGLRKLQGLLVGTGAPPDPLYEMKDLKFLAVTVEEEDGAMIGEEAFSRLQAELPQTTISRVQPLCLGSGFILLLIPLVGGAWWAMRRGERRKPFSHHA